MANCEDPDQTNVLLHLIWSPLFAQAYLPGLIEKNVSHDDSLKVLSKIYNISEGVYTYPDT